jgi:hypothetical protein
LCTPEIGDIVGGSSAVSTTRRHGRPGSVTAGSSKSTASCELLSIACTIRVPITLRTVSASVRDSIDVHFALTARYR